MTRRRAAALAREAGLSGAEWGKPVAALDAAARLRVRLAGRSRSIPPSCCSSIRRPPSIASEVRPLAECIRSAAAARGAATVALTADREFAAAVADRVLSLDGATGRLTAERRSRWFGGLFNTKM